MKTRAEQIAAAIERHRAYMGLEVEILNTEGRRIDPSTGLPLFCEIPIHRADGVVSVCGQRYGHSSDGSCWCGWDERAGARASGGSRT